MQVLACGNGGEGQLGLARNVMEKEYTTKDYGFDLPHVRRTAQAAGG